MEHNTVLRTRSHEGYNDFFWFNVEDKPNTVTLRNNIFILGTPLGKGEIIANPLFVNMEAGDYHLNAGSPAIDAGIDLKYKRDFQNKKVPFGDAPDMGAYEWRGSAKP